MPVARQTPAEPPAARKRISRLHDARAVRSRGALRKALLDLLDVRQFEQVSIKDITEQARVSYPVFFRQFRDKEELLADVATEQVRSLLQFTQDALDPDNPVSNANLCQYVEAHRKLWSTLLTGGASAAMRAEFSRIATEIADTRPRTNPGLPPDLVTELVTNTIFDILTWWMRQPDDYPTANVVKLLDTLVLGTFTSPISIDLA